MARKTPEGTTNDNECRCAQEGSNYGSKNENCRAIEANDYHYYYLLLQLETDSTRKDWLFALGDVASTKTGAAEFSVTIRRSHGDFVESSAHNCLAAPSTQFEYFGAFATLLRGTGFGRKALERKT